jgi:hypothetical protein
MADQHRYTASLRVQSADLRLNDVIAVLGEPTRGHDIGDPVSKRRPNTLRKHSNWTLVADVDRERPLHEHIELVVEFAEAHRVQLARIRPRCDVLDVVCGIAANDAQGGWEFQPALMQRLASLDLPVLFDLYSIAEPDSEEALTVPSVATRTVYVELVDEGVNVWRPVEAVEDGDGFVLPMSAPDGERWRFPPGSRVRCELRELSDGEALVAVRVVS